VAERRADKSVVRADLRERERPLSRQRRRTKPSFSLKGV
jgi:hypothetical protein